MTHVSCKRAWEAEALRDGRLDEKERLSFERHAASCATCTAEARRRETLERLLQHLPVTESDDLKHRRARATLLASANRKVLAHEPRRWLWLTVPVAAAMAFVVLRRAAPMRSDSPSIAPFEVASVRDAEFTSSRIGSVSRITLRSGRASFHVEKVKPEERFLVTLPDGEIEVKGTRFVVQISEGRTTGIEVSEGIVEARLPDFSGSLRAGEHWPNKPPTPPATAVASVALAPTITSPPPAPSTTPSPRPLPGPPFAEAMKAFNAGDYATSERLFAAFVRQFPNDSRAEDAMFLLADARARGGDSRGARDAARAYLQRFPNGLRAPAANRLAAE